MTTSHSYRFSQSVDAIFQSYVDEDFILKKAIDLGARNPTLEIMETEKEIVIESSKEMAVELPGPLKHLANTWNTMSQREVWKGQKGGPYYGTLDVKIEGVPASIKSSMKLAEHEGGTAVAILTEIKSSVPFLGKTIANFIAETSEQIIEEEFEYLKANV